MKMFSEGDAALPALGMEEIPKQLAILICLQILFCTKSSTFCESSIFTSSGAEIKSDIIILAT
jgi:hypothetical protein